MINDFLRARIKRKFAQLKGQDPSYSLRMHAKSLGLSPGAYSEFLAGRRRFSGRKALELAERLHLDANEKKLLSLLTRAERHILPDESFAMIKEWHHFAILSMLELDEGGISATRIARSLGLSKTVVEDSIHKLIDQNLLLKDKDGTLSPTGLSYFTNDDIPSPVIRAAHRDGLKLAAQAIDDVPTLERDFTALTFSGSSRQLARAKKEIRRCLDRVSQIMANPDKDQVYRMSIQLFPVLKTEDSK